VVGDKNGFVTVMGMAIDGGGCALCCEGMDVRAGGSLETDWVGRGCDSDETALKGDGSCGDRHWSSAGESCWEGAVGSFDRNAACGIDAVDGWVVSGMEMV